MRRVRGFPFLHPAACIEVKPAATTTVVVPSNSNGRQEQQDTYAFRARKRRQRDAEMQPYTRPTATASMLIGQSSTGPYYLHGI